jgi:hypothetical protein
MAQEVFEASKSGVGTREGEWSKGSQSHQLRTRDSESLVQNVDTYALPLRRVLLIKLASSLT